MFAMLLALGWLSGCGTQTFESRQYPMRHHERTPKYGRGDTVRQRKSGDYFVVDSAVWREGSEQVFYDAHWLNGIKAKWLPENSIETI